VSRGSRTEIISVLRRFVHGQLSFDELQGFVRSRNFGWLDELLDGIQLEEHDFRELALDERVLSRPVGEYVQGRLPAATLADWSFETYRIFSNGAYPNSEVYSPNVEIALLMICLITECEVSGLHPAPHPIADRILDALERGNPVPAELVIRRLLQNMDQVRLLTRPRAEIEQFLSEEDLWADVALVTTPQTMAAPSAEECWFIPLAVCTRELWLENPPEGVWAHPENDRMHSLRDQFPDLDLEEYEPMYFVGPDGLAEVVLDVERIDTAGLEAAVRLFCLRNRVRCALLDGAHCYPAQEDL
jgi:hypothetical protein